MSNGLRIGRLEGSGRAPTAHPIGRAPTVPDDPMQDLHEDQGRTAERARGRTIARIILATAIAGAPRLATATTEDAGGGVLPGRPIVYQAPPALAREVRACSTRTPICVHAEDRDVRHVLGLLDAADRAYEVLTGALALPKPDPDPDTASFDVFLIAAARETFGQDASTHLAARDVRSSVDRARTFMVIDDRVVPGCARDHAVTRALAEASLMRAAPATDEATRTAMTSYLADLAVPCGLALAGDAVQEFQAHPERGLVDAHGGAADATATAFDRSPDRAALLQARGASFAWARTDWAFSRTPGGIVRAAWALAPTMTAVGAARWNDEPDAFDVLRVTFKDALTRGSTLADLLVDIAVARAFVGSSDDRAHQPEWAVLGDAARLTPEWQLPWPRQPVRIAAAKAVAPTGAAYVRIGRSDRPDARLRVEIGWEEHALFRWTLVKVGKDGRELGRIPVPARERATEAQMSFVDLAGADHFLLVGTNVGDPAYHFDPDDEVWEPHSFLVTMAEET